MFEQDTMIDPMEINLSIQFIVKILNDKPVAWVNVLIGTHIFVDLDEFPESLTQISTDFWN